MTPESGLALLLAVAVVVAWVRLVLRQRRAPAPRWRLALLLLLQPACAGLLYLVLLPPALPIQAGSMTVLTAGADRDLAASRASGETLVALPEAPGRADAERMPDLATALRRHPGTSRLQVIGHGLDPRDHEAARGHALEFEPPPLPPGLVRLDGPGRAVPGAAFAVSGRVNALEDGQVRLLDPAGELVEGAGVDAEGDFHLRGHARAPGLAMFVLQVLDAQGQEVESVPVPLHVAAGPAPRVLLLSGAPNPEFRHLRRWAEDAGLDLHVEVAVGGGVGLGDGPAPTSAEGMDQFDLVILDDRALGGLGASRRGALAQALDAGTGVLLRVGGELPASVRGHMADLGLAVSEEAGTEAVQLPQVDDPALLRARLGPGSEDAPFDPALSQEAPPELMWRALRPQAADAVPLLVGEVDTDFAWWRAQGRGRIGLWTLTDSYRLALAGRDDLHAGLWSAAAAALARPAVDTSPRFETAARADRRLVICGLEDPTAQVLAPDGGEVTVLVDPAAAEGRYPAADTGTDTEAEAAAAAAAGTGPGARPGANTETATNTNTEAGSGAGTGLGTGPDDTRTGPDAGTGRGALPGCAAYWPAVGGWHLLRVGEDAWPFHVRAADEAPGIAVAGLREETQRLAGAGVGPALPAAAEPGASPARRGPSWPWFIAWLAVSALLWWLERRRRM